MRLLVPGFFLNTPQDRLAELAKYYDLPLVTSKSLLTASIREKSCLGDRVKRCLESGKFIPDSLFLQLLEEKLTESDMRRGWILAGFPRTLSQAAALNSMLLDIGQSYDRVIHFKRDNHPSSLTFSNSQLTDTQLTNSQPTYPDYLPEQQLLQSPLVKFYSRLRLFISISDDTPLTIVDNALKSSPQEFTNKNLPIRIYREIEPFSNTIKDPLASEGNRLTITQG